MRVQKSKTRSKPFKKSLIISVVVVAVIALSYFATAYATKLPPFATESTTESIDGVNLEKSETEKAAAEALKENPEDKIQNNQNDTPSTPAKDASGKQEANVLLTNAGIYNGTVSTGGMVTNVTENSGECVYEFTQGSQKITKSTSTLVNPTSTTCKTVSFPASELTSAGTWKVTLVYTSAVSSGTSNSKDIVK